MVSRLLRILPDSFAGYESWKEAIAQEYADFRYLVRSIDELRIDHRKLLTLYGGYDSDIAFLNPPPNPAIFRMLHVPMAVAFSTPSVARPARSVGAARADDSETPAVARPARSVGAAARADDSEIPAVACPARSAAAAARSDNSEVSNYHSQIDELRIMRAELNARHAEIKEKETVKAAAREARTFAAATKEKNSDGDVESASAPDIVEIPILAFKFS
jgi:hypothetical protein